MDNFESLKQIWLSEKGKNLPNFEELQKAISVEKNHSRKRIRFSILATAVLLISICLVAFFSEAKLLSTLVGELLMFSSIFILLTSRINSLRRSFRNENCSNREFIAKLKIDVERLRGDWNAVQKIGFVLVGTGYLLFLYESVYQNKQVMIIGYALTTIVLSAMWLFLRPLANRRKLEKKERLLEKIENLSNEIEE